MSNPARYEFLEKIGEGSFATVYRARDLELGREVAIKQIHDQFLSDPKLLNRYWQEAQLLASLQHPNIVTIYDIHRDRGWLILELMQANLRDRLAGRQMDLRSLRTTLAHSLRALKYLHSRGVIHGDIKPGNLMIDHRKRIKIGDFGLARRVSNAEGSLIKGTTKYMAPEVVSEDFGEVGPHSDLYSLGFTAYELMCGPNFDDLFPGLNAFGRDRQAAWMMWHAAPDRRLPEISRVLQGVPQDLSTVIQRLTEKDISKRYSSADQALSDLHIDLKLVKQGDSDDIDPAAPAPSDAPPASRKRTWIAAAAFAGSLILSTLMLFFPSGSSHSGPARTTFGVVRKVLVEQSLIEYEDPERRLAGEIKLGDQPRIHSETENRPILLKAVQPEDYIEFTRSADASGTAITELKVWQPVTSRGKLAAIDLANRKLTLAVEDARFRQDLVISAPENAQLKLNGQNVPLHELVVNDAAEFRHILLPQDRAGHRLVSLNAQRIREIVGNVDRVDTGSNVIALQVGLGSSPMIRSFEIAPDCKMQLHSGQTLAFSDIRPGDRVKLSYDTRVHLIDVTRAQLNVSGAVQEINLADNEFTLQSNEGKMLRFKVAPATQLTLDFEPIAVADLRPKIDLVRVQYDEPADAATPVASVVDADRGLSQDRWAIFISTQAYSDPSLPRLNFAIEDSERLYESMIRRYALDPDWALRLIDENLLAAQDRIRKLLANTSAGAQVIVYISGHAFTDDSGKTFIALKDFRADDRQRTGLPLDWLVEQLGQAPPQRILILLDACHEPDSTPAQPPTVNMLASVKTQLKKTIAIASCAAGQRGWDWPDKRRGVFAWHLANAFSGAADTNRDLDLTPDELFAYLQSSMKGPGLPPGRTQTPVLVKP